MSTVSTACTPRLNNRQRVPVLEEPLRRSSLMLSELWRAQTAHSPVMAALIRAMNVVLHLWYLVLLLHTGDPGHTNNGTARLPTTSMTGPSRRAATPVTSTEGSSWLRLSSCEKYSEWVKFIMKCVSVGLTSLLTVSPYIVTRVILKWCQKIGKSR